MITQPGIYPDMSSAEYFADPCPNPSLTQSIAKVLIERSPLHAWHEHPRLGAKPAIDDEPSENYEPAKAIGNAAHKIAIDRGREVRVFDYDNWKTRLAREQRDACFASGSVPILQKHFVRARNMVEVARERIGGVAFHSGAPGRGEVVLIWREGDLWFRTMIDWLDNDLRTAWDYKTSAMSCAPHALAHLMMSGGWDVQAAMHERALNTLDPAGAGRRKFRFVAQENTQPYATSVCQLTEAVLTMGRKKLAYAVQLWGACMRANVWPSYPPEIHYPEYPGYAETKWLDREVEHEERQKRPHERDARNLMAG